MCLQCVTEADYITAVLGTSLHLTRATKDAPEEWLAGQWGLLCINDPEVVWSGPMPWPDPSFGVPDEIAESWDAAQNALADQWMRDARDFATSFEEQVGVYSAYDIGALCQQSGWTPKDGRFTFWLYHKMGEACLNPVSIADEETDEEGKGEG